MGSRNKRFGTAGGWLYVKMLFVSGLIGYQVLCWYMLKRMLAGNFSYGPIQLRLFNEAPLLLLVPIIIFVVIKPL